MRVIQLLTTMSYGDAVSNDVMALYNSLNKTGFATGIYAENIDARLTEKFVQHIEKMPKLRADDVIIYHLSTGTELNFKFVEYKGRKIVIYHNITPYHFFANYSDSSLELCKAGELGMKFLADKVDYCLADSEFNKKDLEKAKYNCKIDVLPILIPFSDYEKKPDNVIVRRYRNDGYTNILFTGRIAPNKKQEDVIRAFYMYQKYYNKKSRLFIVGSFTGMEKYYKRLKRYVAALELENVIFTGHIKFNEILAYYHVADLFLCMSEHEGFCVPLIEAMYFNIPIIAYDSTAVGHTLGNAGILLKKKEPLEVAGMINYVIEHPEMRTEIAKQQQNRLKNFEHDQIEKQFLTYLNGFLKEGKQ